MLCACGFITTLNAQQDLKNSVCVVKQNYTDAESEAYEKMASTLFSNSYMSAARQLRKKSGSFGSGFLYKADNGKLYIITNKHVVRDAKSVQLIFKEDGGDKTIPNCNVVAKSDSTDIAIVEFPASETEFVPLSFHTEPVTDGTSVWSAGFPGLGDEPSWQLGNGIVSNGRYSNLELTDSAHVDVIQHTAQVDPGSSGGPLLILKETNKTITKEEMVGKKKQTVTETITEKTYEVVGMNTWKAFHRENVNFSLMSKDIVKVVNNLGAVSSSKTKDDVGLQKQVEKYVETFSESSSEMLPFISRKMITSLSEEQLTAMLKNISGNANNALRNGAAVEGLKIMVADNIKSPIQKPEQLKVGDVSVNGDAGTATFSYGKKQFTSTWEKTYDGWQLTSTDLIEPQKIKAKKTVDSGFRVLDLDAFHRVAFSFMAPIGNPFVVEDNTWRKTATYNDKVKFGFEYSLFCTDFLYWTIAFDYGKIDCTLDSYNMNWAVPMNTLTPIGTETSETRHFSALTGMGVQCPMAVKRIYFAPDIKAQIGFRKGMGEAKDNICFSPTIETTLNVGYMFDNEKIIYIGSGLNMKRFVGGFASDIYETNVKSIRYFIVKVGFLVY